MDNLLKIVGEEVAKYVGSGRGINLRLFSILDDVHQTYAVIAVDYPTRYTTAGVVVFVRVAEDKIIIEEDATNKKLVDALLQHGIAREQIILVYEGETFDEEAVLST